MSEDPKRGVGRAVVVLVFRWILPVVVVVLAVVGARRMLETAPKAPRGAGTRTAKLVEVVEVASVSRGANLEAMGVVRPARRATLSPQVSGRVVWVAEELIPGGRLAAGVPLVRIDRRDYEIALAQRESERLVAEAAVVEAGRRVAQAERDLRIEEGNRAVAQSEIEAFGEEVDPAMRDLVLRVPQLAAARADLMAAQAGVGSAEAAVASAASRVERAELDLERTAVLAPFDVAVEDEQVNVGDLVSPGQRLADMVGTGETWVELSLPVTDLHWVEIPTVPGETGSVVELPDGREGRVLRLIPSVDERGRMARVLVGVTGSPFLLGSYVRAVIRGRRLEALVALPRSLLRDGERAWVMTPDDVLSIRTLDIAYRGRDEILVRGGLTAGERVVVTDLAAPVEGMALRVEGSGPGTETVER